ncbi:hypothetical protein AAFF_G00332000 [Aldrovandia affinis]|uniref:Uncharacterized protein n=1 Tax=Aldrovandia affinis TaxID=143900 RepID=A0AAD7SLQ4_9TELE|nr:hypothetical protein AAFF_G00332000 [Aldrovandia affinis]
MYSLLSLTPPCVSRVPRPIPLLDCVARPVVRGELPRDRGGLPAVARRPDAAVDGKVEAAPRALQSPGGGGTCSHLPLKAPPSALWQGGTSRCVGGRGALSEKRDRRLALPRRSAVPESSGPFRRYGPSAVTPPMRGFTGDNPVWTGS